MSSTPTTPILLPDDLKFYLSGGYYNTDPPLSLGGEISSFQLVSGTLNGLFDRVDTSEAELGDIEYRCIYLRNTSQTRKLLSAKIWIETGTAGATTSIAISLGSSGINGTEPTIPDEGIEPPMNFFELPLQQPDEPNIGDLYPGDHIALWVRWYVQAGTTSIADDFAVLRIDGEREVESVSQPIPDPTDPPPTTGCPQGSKWSPAEMRCVDDATVIICPNGYTYNSSTQRCVPPSTPPPTLPNWTFAAAGDFSCTGDADATGVLIGSKLNKTAGNDIGLLLALGDFSYEDGDESCWYDNMESNLGPTLYPANVAPILGNHDDGEDGSSADRTSVIAEFPLMPTQAYYAFTRRNIRFIMMDTQSSYGTSSAQFAFVKAELEAATANPSIMWKVVCYHKPSFTTGSYYGPLTDFQDAYHALFTQHKVNLVFNGHNHIYFRSKPVRFTSTDPSTPVIASDQTGGNYINVDGTVYITSGAAGRSSHTEVDSTVENFVGFRHTPSPYGSVFVTLQDSGNQLRIQFIANSNQVLDDFTLSKPGATPPPTGEAVCPQGFHYDDGLGRCIISPQQCPTNYRWEPTQNRCVAMSGEPPPPPGPVDPMAGVEWYYDSTATQNTPQTISPAAYDSVEGIVLCGDEAGVTGCTISNGYFNIQTGTGGTAGIFFDYWKKPRFTTDDKPGFNTAMLFTFVYENQMSFSIYDGNQITGGFTPDLIFGGFGFNIIGDRPTIPNGLTNQSNSTAKYWSNPSNPSAGQFGEQITSIYPGGRTLETGKTYKVFFTIRTNRVTNIVVQNVWLDFGDGDGWQKIQTDRTWSSSNWGPTSVPTGYDDTSQILQGPAAIKRYHVFIRNNEPELPKPDLRIKDIKIGTLPYLSDVNNPPPGTGNPGPGTGTGGVLDSRGIRWYYATGQQGVIGQSRDEATDDRWSGNVSGVSQYGYEITMIMQNFSGVGSDGHFAMKHGGPNHSGDCGHTESGDCCCWYDTGIRSNGDIQLQTERPHPSNHDFDLPSSQLFMNNIGKGMNGNSIGLKWIWHPVTPGGDADNGGILLMMWVDTDPIGTDGKPKNNWRLVYKFTDTGQVLGDYPPPDEHDLEVRNSDTDDRDAFGGGLHWRKIQANDTLQWGTGSTGGGTGGTGGGGTTTPPPPTTGGTVLWDSNIHGLWNNGISRTVTDTEGNQGVNGKGIFTAASGNPVFQINGSGQGDLICDADSHGRIYIKASNYNAILTVEFRFNHSSILSTTTKLRSRHHIDEEDADCEDRFGGFGAHVSLEEQNAGFQIETCHNEHEPSVDFDLPVNMNVGSWYKYRFSLTNINNNTQVFQKLEMDFNDGQGFRLIGQDTHTSPEAHWMDEPSFNDSVIWLRSNTGSSDASVSFRNVRLVQYASSTTPPTEGGGTGGGGTNTSQITYTYSSQFGTQGSGNGQFVDPHDIALDTAGNLFVCDPGRQDIQKFTPQGVYVSKFGSGGTGTGQFDFNYGIAIDSNNEIFIADSQGHKVMKFSSTGTHITTVTTIAGANPSTMDSPEAIAFDPVNDDVYVCDARKNRILKFDNNLNYILSWGSLGTGDNQFDHPHGIAVDSNRNVYVCQSGVATIKVYTSTGVFLRKWGTSGTGTGQLLPPLEHMDIDPANRIYVVNNDVKPIISVFDSFGTYITKFGSDTPGSGNGQFREPENCRISNNFTAYVVDRENYRVQVFSPNVTGGGTTFKILSWGDNDVTQDAEDVLNMMFTESNVEQYLFAGDGPYSNSGTAWVSQMSSYFNTTTLKSKLMLAQGNHEHPESASQQAENDIEAWFPGLHNATNEGLEWLQAKQVRNCYIIVMNSQDPNINTVGGAQYNWVQARLNDAVALRNAGQIKWIIMMVHKNWFSITNFSPDAFATRYVYQTMLNNAQVDFMFSGHTHTYQLWKPITTRSNQSDETDQGTQLLGSLLGSGQWNFAVNHGVVHCINGNGGHEINSFGSNPIPSTILYSNDNEFGYTVLEINGSVARLIVKSVGGNVRYTATFVR